jgi:cell wall-associated NlpC family hydrolase
VNQLVELARSYIGTPFHHQGRVPKVGLDCAGLVICCLKELNTPIDDVSGYARVPSSNTFTNHINKFYYEIDREEIQEGDLVTFVFRTEPQHIAIISNIEPVRIIHAHSAAHGVVEVDLDDIWQSKVYKYYRMRVT